MGPDDPYLRDGVRAMVAYAHASKDSDVALLCSIAQVHACECAIFCNGSPYG